MDPQIIAFVAIVVGAMAGVAVPYLLKVYEEGVAFEVSYFYTMILSLVMAAFFVIPDNPDLSFKGLLTLFLAGAGLEWMVNKVNTIRIKKKEEEEEL